MNDWTICKNCQRKENNSGWFNNNHDAIVDSIDVKRKHQFPLQGSNIKKISRRFPLKSFSEPTFISGVNTDTLSIKNIPFAWNHDDTHRKGTQFSLVMSLSLIHI
mgnify:FL=1